MPDPASLAEQAWRLARLARPGAMALVRSRITPPLDPRATARLLMSLGTWGVGPGIGFAGGAARHPQDLAVIDDDPDGRSGTFADLEASVRVKTRALRATRFPAGAVVGVLSRNSLAYAEAIAVLSRLEADILYLNTGFPAERVAQTCADLGVASVLASAELAGAVPPHLLGAVLDGPEWTQLQSPAQAAALPLAAHLADVQPRSRGGRHILLTSGTTGRPKGAPRAETPLEAVVSLLSGLPFRQRDTHVMAAPVFHAWGWMNHRMAALLDTTEVMLPRAGAEQILAAVERHRAATVVTTPVAVLRLAHLPEETVSQYDLSSLRIIAVSGAAIPPDAVELIAAKYGPVLHSLYGSTEVGYAACAGPDDLAADPSCAGRVLPGVTVEIRGPDGLLPPGEVGQVWAASSASFGGYLDGTDSQRAGGLINTGDEGLITSTGILSIKGRSDDVIVCGGENVHPAEVEAVLRRHEAVSDAAVIGRPDPTWGTVPIAFVVLHEGRTAQPSELLEWAQDRLAAYQRPRELLVRQDLPRNDTGKVVRGELARQLPGAQ